MLLSLLLLPVSFWLYLLAQRRRQRLMANLGPLGLLQDQSGKPLGWRRHLPMGFFLLGLGLLFFALARPEMPLTLPRIEGTIILAFDVSASMGADDLEPTRMEAAKTAALAFIQDQPSTVRIGVVAFSEGGLVVQPATNEQIDLIDAINRLAPQSGTSLGQGILAGLNTILTDGAPPVPAQDSGGSSNGDGNASAPPLVPTPLPSGSFSNAAIVLITDGENMSDPDPMDAAERAADYGVRLHTVGLGSVAGTTLEVDGFTVVTRLDEEMLRTLSEITNGTYYNAESAADLAPIYDNLSRQLTLRADPTEVTAVFTGLSILCLLVGGIVSLFWFGRVI
jgi:Ca-activated chloride channel family protein